MMLTVETSEVADLVGVAEIAERLRVPRTTVSMWAARRSANGFPAPVKPLAMGPVYDFGAVQRWHDRKAGE